MTIEPDKFIEFIASILEVSPASLSLESTQSDVPEWDSMAHLRLVMEIQNEYGVTIPLVDFVQLKSLGDLYNKIIAEK